MFVPEGVYPAMFTPFTDDYQINEPVLRDLIDFMIEKGVYGLFPVASAGEFFHLSIEERMRLMDIAVDQARGRVPVTPGAGDTNPRNVLRLARHAQELGCPAVVVMAPYFFPVTQEIVERHFEEIAENLDLSIILYNIPSFANRISDDVVKRLARIPNIVAMKDSQGDGIQLMHFIDKARIGNPNFAVLVGRVEILFPALMAGAKGCMVAECNLIPEVVVGIYNSFKAGDLETARKLQFYILKLCRAIASVQFPIGYKAGAEARGFRMGPPMQPLSEAEEYTYIATKARIENLVAQVLEEAEALLPKVRRLVA